MYSADDLVKLLKKAANEAVDASKPANMVFGKVISANPLKIQVEQKLILTSMQLVLTRNVTDFETEIDVSYPEWKTEYKSGGSGEASFASHDHEITGTKKIKVMNALKANEEVVLMQVSGGQKYIVIDRLG